MQWTNYINKLIDISFEEDLGDGDHTSLACIPTDAKGKAKLLVKEPGILAGTDIAKLIFTKLDPKINFELKINDGEAVSAGDIAFYVSGHVIALLQAERTVLNFMQRMSGIATQTRRYVDELHGLKTKVLDTRKTTPGLRLIEKKAVKVGGGENHRMGLHDLILIKDNHVDFAGGIAEAIKRSQTYLKTQRKDLEIVVETRSLSDIETALQIGGIKRIMLDNFSIEQTKEAVELIAGRCQIESSGGITIDNLREYAECGVDYISVGALTHQIKSLDLSLKAIDY